MRFDPSLTTEEWVAAFRIRAREQWGETRALSIDETLIDLSTSVQRIVSHRVDSEEEPFLLNSEPFTMEEL